MNIASISSNWLMRRTDELVAINAVLQTEIADTAASGRDARLRLEWLVVVNQVNQAVYSNTICRGLIKNIPG